jgi:hypothetical protein
MTDARTLITREEIAAFVVKLEQWAQGLPPKERALLDALVNTASRSAPEGLELSDEQLASVAGGVGSQFQARVSNVFSAILKPDISKSRDCI